MKMATSINEYPDYIFLRPITKFAGVIGVFQSLLWLSFSTTGIIAYFNCNLDGSKPEINLGNITPLSLYEIYFRHRDSCDQPTPLEFFDDIPRHSIFGPSEINSWMFVYLALNAIWLLSSISLFTSVEKDKLRQTSVVLYLWCSITLLTLAIDLSLGIIFGIDFDRYREIALELTDFDNTSLNKQIGYISAQTASLSMLIVAFKGFVLWLLDAALVVYLLAEAIAINKKSYNPPKTGYSNKGFVSETHSILTHTPINAYQMNTRFSEPVALNVDSLKRANAIAISETSLREKRLAEAKNNHNGLSELTPRNSFKPEQPYVPRPDYTPPLQPRFNSGRPSHESNKPAFLNKRYQ